MTAARARDPAEQPWITRVRTALAARVPVKAEGEGKETRKAAVAVILRPGDDGEPEVFFIRRAEYPGDPWSGQVAFPGGRQEPGDASLEETAVRETLEETGIDLARNATLLGVLDDLSPRVHRIPSIVVTPYVMVLNSNTPLTLTLSPEVALAFWIPLAALSTGGSWRETEVLARGVHFNARAFDHEGHIIWGMTERMLAQLLMLLEEIS